MVFQTKVVLNLLLNPESNEQVLNKIYYDFDLYNSHTQKMRICTKFYSVFAKHRKHI